MPSSSGSVDTKLSVGRLLFGSALAGGVCAVVLLATSPGLPMAWDEGDAILRAEKIEQGRWEYTTQREGHPAFYGIVIATGQSISAAWLRPLDAARFGPMMLFALAAGVMCFRMWRDYSALTAMAAVAAMMLLPRMFAHAHFASFDGPLSSCWVLTWATFAPARKRWRWAVLWGIVLGATFSCKATGWIAPLPFIAWTACYRDRRAAKALAIGLPVALVAFFVFNPPLWHDPIHGTATFFNLNLNRASNPGLNISTWFLGRMYNLDYPLPWYNTLVWTAVTVPLGTLLLTVVGVVASLRRWRLDRPGTLLLANWLVLLIIRALPFSPPHDGVRLFLPCFAFLAALAGVGCAEVYSWAARRWMNRRRATAAVALASIYIGSATSLFWYTPQWLSYYNLLIGGLSGATAAGMEPTYYWDGLDRSVLDWLQDHTAEDEKVCFGAASPKNFALLRRWNTVDFHTEAEAPGRYRWYVLQHRPSGHQVADVWLIEHAEPAHRKVLRAAGFGPWRLDVPLVEVYDYAEYLRASSQAKRVTSAPKPRHD